jgi:beta-galactosidase/beta-glucuronidase
LNGALVRFTKDILFIMQLKNAQFFDTTEAFEFSWILQGDGHVIGSGFLDVPFIEPQRDYDIKFKSSPWETVWKGSEANEIYLTITMKLKHATRWVNEGHVIASTQLSLPSKASISHVLSCPYLITLYTSVICFLDIYICSFR